jgi:hypothetical protein
MARFLVLPSHIVSSILGAGSRPLCARALTAGEPPHRASGHGVARHAVAEPLRSVHRSASAHAHKIHQPGIEQEDARAPMGIGPRAPIT